MFRGTIPWAKHLELASTDTHPVEFLGDINYVVFCWSDLQVLCCTGKRAVIMVVIIARSSFFGCTVVEN